MNTESQSFTPRTNNFNLDGLRKPAELKKAGFTKLKCVATQGKTEFVRKFVAKAKGDKKEASFAYQYQKGLYEPETVYKDTLAVVAQKAGRTALKPTPKSPRRKVK